MMDQIQTSFSVVVIVMILMGLAASSHDYGDALTKSILFFEGQRSGKLPSIQRLTWRKDSALRDGFEIGVFQFADTYRGSYNDSLGPWVCPFYCDFNGYEDELVWAAAWLYKATKSQYYWSYVTQNIYNLENNGAIAEFGWDAKHAGINVLASKMALANSSDQGPFVPYADKFVCTILPESPTVSVSYSPGGLLFKPGGSNLQHTTALSFLLLTYARYLGKYNRNVKCGDVSATPARLVQFAQNQVDYILGSNPINMSYMVGYGEKFPERIHHRGSSLPSIADHPSFIDCQAGSTYFGSSDPNPNLLIGAVVGGPDVRDDYNDSRSDFVHTEPTTYINAPLIGLLAYFRSHVLII